MVVYSTVEDVRNMMRWKRQNIFGFKITNRLWLAIDAVPATVGDVIYPFSKLRLPYR